MKNLKKYKPIRIFDIHYGYGWWWKDYFFFFGHHSTSFGIMPMCFELYNATYANGKAINHGDTKSWSESRQREAYA